MATVVDALVVTFGLDASPYLKGARKVGADLKTTREDADKTAKMMEESGKRAASFFSSLRREALMFVGVLAGATGVKDLVGGTLTQARSLGFMSQALGMNIKRLQGWQMAAKEAGASAADMTAQLNQSQSAIGTMRRGLQDETVTQFHQYGGTGNVRFMTPEQYLLDRLAIVQRIDKTAGVASARTAAHLMGINDSLFNFALLGNDKIKALVDQMTRLAPYSQQDAAVSTAVYDSWIKLTAQFKKVTSAVGVALIPLIKELTAWLGRIATWADSHQTQIVAWVRNAVREFRHFVGEVNKVVQSLGGWKHVLEILAAFKVASIISRWTPLLLLFTGLARSIGLVTTALGLATSVPAVAGAALLYSKGTNESDAQDKALQAPGKALQKRQDEAMKFFMSKGWTAWQSAGIVANLTRESGLVANQKGDYDIATGKYLAYGIGQWHPARMKAFQYFLNAKYSGVSAASSTLQEQLAFVDYGLRHDYKYAGDLIKASKSSQTSAVDFSKQYERPAATTKEAAIRAAMSAAILMRSARRGVVPLNAGSTIPGMKLLPSLGTLQAVHYTTNNSNDVNINGPLTVTTNATDARGVANGLRSLGRTNPLATQTQSGLR